jgi:hypothetical protein
MADNTNIIITVTADDSGAIQSINKLGQEINTAGDASKSWIKQLGELKTQLSQLDPNSAQWAELAIQYKELGGSAKVVSQSFEDLKTQAAGVGGSIPTEPVKNFRQQIKELTNELQTTQLSKTSAEYLALKNRLEQLKDAQKDFNEEIGANAGPAFESAGNNLNNLRTRLSSLDFGGAADSINGLAKNVKGLNFSGATEGLSAFGKSILNLGKALLTNPIFLIGGVIALIVTNFDKLANVVPLVGLAFEAIGKVVGFVKDAITGFTDAIGLTSVAAADAVDSAIGNLEDKQKTLDNARRLAVANAEKTGGDVAAINKKYQDKQISENDNLINQVNALEKRGVKLTEEQLSARKKAIEANTEIAIKNAETEAEAVQKAREETAKAEEAAQQKAAADALAAQQRAKQRADAIKAAEKEVTDALKSAQEERYQNTLTAEGKELRQNELKYDALAEKAGKNSELLAQIEADRLKSEQEIRDQYAKEEIAKEQTKQDALLKIVKQNEVDRLNELEALNELEFQAGLSAREKELTALRDAQFEKITELENGGGSAVNLREQLRLAEASINKKYDDADTAAANEKAKKEQDQIKALRDARIQNAQNGLNALLALNDAFAGKSEKAQKAAFNRNKAIQIAQASINTYQSATAAYGSQLTVGDVTSPVRATIAAAIAVASGLANVAKIAKTTFNSPAPSGGADAGGAGGGALANTGVASTGGAPEFNPLAMLAITGQPQQVTPAYVLASDIASSMEARAKVTDLSRL